MDANTAALKEQESKMAAQESSRDAFLKRIEPELKQIGHLISECQLEAEDNLYDFSAELKEELLSLL